MREFMSNLVEDMEWVLERSEMLFFAAVGVSNLLPSTAYTSNEYLLLIDENRSTSMFHIVLILLVCLARILLIANIKISNYPEIECMDTASSSKQVANYARRIKSFWTQLDFKHNVHILIQSYDTS